MKLDKQIEPLPARLDAARPPALRARAQVRRARRPASSGRGRACGGLDDPGRARRARAGRARRVLQHVRRQGARRARATRSTATAAGSPGRGQDLNTAIEAFVPLLRRTSSRWLRTCPTRRRGLDRFFRALGRAAAEAAPVAEEQAVAVREPRHLVHGAGRHRPPLPPGDDQREPARRGGRDPRLPAPAPVPPQQRRRSSASCAPAWRRCRTPRRSSPTPSRPARDVLPRRPAAERGPRGRLRRARRLLRRPARARAGSTSSRGLSSSLRPDAALPHAGPDRLQLRDALVPQRREPALRRRPERHLAALHGRRGADRSAARTCSGRTTRACRRARPRTARRSRTTCT